MSINSIRALVLLANVLLLGLIGWACWGTFFTADEERYRVRPPDYARLVVPEVAQDPLQQQRTAYAVIARVWDRPMGPPPREAAAPEPEVKPLASQIQVLAVNYDTVKPERSSALLQGPLAREPRFFQVGVDLGADGLGFERYKGVKVKAITETDTVLVDQNGQEVKLSHPRSSAPSGGR